MKNNNITEAFSKIEPDSFAQKRILQRILSANQTHSKENNLMKKKIKWITVVICMVVLIGLGISHSKIWFYKKNIVTGDGYSLTFVQTDLIANNDTDWGTNAVSRDLSSDEIKTIFGDLNVKAYGFFNADNHSLLKIEGTYDDFKIIVSAPGISITDSIIDQKREESLINNISVSAGYYVSDKNSQGIRNIIYFATFKLGDSSVYLQLNGEESESEVLEETFASIINKLTLKETLDLFSISNLSY